MDIVARIDTGALPNYQNDPVVLQPAPEALLKADQPKDSRLQRALDYLGDRHITRLDSTFKPSKELILDQWKAKRLEQKMKKPKLKPV